MADDVPRRRRSRVDPQDTSYSVHVSFPSRQYDHLYAIARQRGVSVSAIVRTIIQRALPAPARDPPQVLNSKLRPERLS